jgi:hypothetical protein
MNLSKLEELLEEMFDCALTYHGYTPYLRDYEFVVYQSVDPNPQYGLVPRHLRFFFRICPEVTVVSAVRPEVWSRSLDDRLLLEHNVTMESKGYVWGVRSQVLYPGASIVPNSARARFWETNLGIPFHEVIVKGNAHEISLVFSELVVDEVGEGYAPYLVEHGGVPEIYENGAKRPLKPRNT